ncbi:hypothetical protein KI387_021463, partial [Taxus chinensis]
DDRHRLCRIGVDWIRSVSTGSDRCRLIEIGVDWFRSVSTDIDWRRSETKYEK